MKHQRMILLLALCVVTAACGMPDFSYTGKNGNLTLKGNVLTLHVHGIPNASIGSSGDWNVDGKAVSVTPSERGLLMLYYQDVINIRTQSVEMGKTGAEESVKAIKNSIAGKSEPNKKQKIYNEVTAQANQLSLKMCQDQVNLKTLQDQLVKQIPSFKPYGAIFASNSVDECMKENHD